MPLNRSSRADTFFEIVKILRDSRSVLLSIRMIVWRISCSSGSSGKLQYVVP